MASRSENEIREALAEVLNLYDIKIDINQSDPEESQSDYSDIISHTQAKLDDLNEKAEEIFKRTEMTRDELEIYASNPNNFSKEQWEALQKVKAACERYKREARSRISDPQFEKKAQSQERKKESHRFAKKKKWIPL